MPCFQPYQAGRPLYPNADGSRPISFGGRVYRDIDELDEERFVVGEMEYLHLPCGTCDGCLLERSRQWAIRISHEASLFEENCFVTLTYADEHLPANGGLWPEDFTAFMKALRQKIAPVKVRYFMCGEYGALYGRPHFHAILFGWWFPDSVSCGERNGMTVWRSELLERLWRRGRTEIGTVTFESAAYVARYVLKKRSEDGERSGRAVMGAGADALPARHAPYARMSRRPGIGARWIEQFCGEVIAGDSVVVRGRESKPPRYYDLVAARFAPEAVEANKRKRELGDPRGKTCEGREAAAVIAAQRVNLFRRELD